MALRDYICPQCTDKDGQPNKQEEIVKFPPPPELPCRQCTAQATLSEEIACPVDTGWRYPAPSKAYLDAN